jgi:hypothetical protein
MVSRSIIFFWGAEMKEAPGKHSDEALLSHRMFHSHVRIFGAGFVTTLLRLSRRHMTGIAA